MTRPGVEAARFLLDLIEAEVLDDLVVEIADRWGLDPAGVHTGVSDLWTKFRAERERAFEAGEAAPDAIGPVAGRA